MKNLLYLIGFIICSYVGCQWRGSQLVPGRGVEPSYESENILAWGNPYATHDSLTMWMDEVQRRITRIEKEHNVQILAHYEYKHKYWAVWEINIPDGPGTDLIVLRHHDIDEMLKFLMNSRLKKLSD